MQYVEICSNGNVVCGKAGKWQCRMWKNRKTVMWFVEKQENGNVQCVKEGK